MEACNHLIAVRPDAGLDWTRLNELVGTIALTRKVMNDRIARLGPWLNDKHPAWVDRVRKMTDLELFVSENRVFAFCPDCGAPIGHLFTIGNGIS